MTALLRKLALSLGFALGVLGAAGAPVSAYAQGVPDTAALEGEKTIWLSNSQGERVAWGKVSFTPKGGGVVGFSITPSAQLREHFLAMRPFKCLAGARQQVCWFPYTVPAAQIVGDDFGALELALMFLHTKPGALHINSANGLYYRLKREGKGLRGALHDVDMDPIVVPRGDPQRPIKPSMLTAADPASHWLGQLQIE
jgi:hypothetical protein